MDKRKNYIQKEQRRIARVVTQEFKDYYLTGGTALAFYFKHRFSEDLDFFSPKYRKSDPNKIMRYIAKQTGFSYQLDSVQDGPKVVPMQVYFIELKDSQVLKIDFVKDYFQNLNPVKNGLHSIEDIYLRKIYAAIGTRGEKLSTGRTVATGRQSVKDLFDLYYLSCRYEPLSEFFFKYFSSSQAAQIDTWYRGFNRLETKLSLIDLVDNIDSGKIFKYLDDQILKKIPSKL